MRVGWAVAVRCRVEGTRFATTCHFEYWSLRLYPVIAGYPKTGEALRLASLRCSRPTSPGDRIPLPRPCRRGARAGKNLKFLIYKEIKRKAPISARARLRQDTGRHRPLGFYHGSCAVPEGTCDVATEEGNRGHVASSRPQRRAQTPRTDADGEPIGELIIELVLVGSTCS